MPLPFIIGGAAIAAKVVLGAAIAAGGVGVVKGVKGAVDNSDAKSFQAEAEKIKRQSQKSMEAKKEETKVSIEQLGKTKVDILANQITPFINSYQKIKNIQINNSEGINELNKIAFSNEELSEMKKISNAAIDFLSGAVTGAGTGALVGWGAYTGVMTLGAASTGTAIGGLSGVAATNATLAWLGGGSLAAGGGWYGPWN